MNKRVERLLAVSIEYKDQLEEFIMKCVDWLLIHGVEKVVQGKVLHIQEGLVGGDYDEKGGQVVVVRWEVLHIQEGPVGGVHEQEDGEVAGCVHRVQGEVHHIQEGLVRRIF